MERAEIERLGDALYLAMCDRRMVAPLTDSHPNLTIEQAYEISLRFLANRLNAGERIIGKKIGVTSAAVMDMLGVRQPDFGFMTDAMRHDDVMAISGSLIQPRADRIDGSVAGLGAGAGNTPLEVLSAVLHRMGAEDGIDLYKIMDVAEDLVVPMMDQPIRVDRDSLTLGYAGVYSSFLLFAKRAGEKYGVPARDLLVELGRRGTVGGQEDMIEDLALTMSSQKP